MSANAVVLNTGNQAIVNYDTAKFILRDSRFIPVVYTNSTGAAVDLLEGQVFGRISATGKGLPLASAAVDGSQYFLGFNFKPQTVANGATVTIDLLIRGEVDKGLVVLNGADAFTTVISGRILQDWIEDRVLMIPVTELTGYDNQ